MLMRILILLVSVLAVGAQPATAKSRHRHAHQVPATAIQPLPTPQTGPTLVMHPASNIACNTPYRATRALPCDQPVWVYGRPCEIDLGLGRYRSCD
jgi:hypothetical protein